MVSFIAEVSSNHHKDLDRCLKFIDTASAIGCDAIKFQLFKLDELFSLEARAAKPEIEKRRAWELPIEFLPELKNHCNKKALKFSCTPFYLEAVDELAPYVDFYKVASYELLWHDLLLKIASTDKPVLLSTGMANIREISDAVDVFKGVSQQKISLLHCISGYPTPIGDCNLSAIQTLREYFLLEVGWSDHSKNGDVIARAISRYGSSVIEFHLDLDGEGDEFKTGHCWLPSEIEKIIRTVRSFELMDGNGDKQPMPSETLDREWRADPTDGRRPLIYTRRNL